MGLPWSWCPPLPGGPWGSTVPPPPPVSQVGGSVGQLVDPIVTQPGHSSLTPGPPSTNTLVYPPSLGRTIRKSRFGGSALASGGHTPDPSSDEEYSGEDDECDASVHANDLYFSAHQRLSGALDVVMEVSPEVFTGADEPSSYSELSGIEEILGCSSSHSVLPELKESKLVAAAVRAAFQRAADSCGKATELNSPGRFLARVPPWFHRASCLRLRRESLPVRPLELSYAEKDLVSVKSAPISVFDKTLFVWEGQLLAALENLSLADTLLAGVGRILVPPTDSGSPGPHLSESWAG